MKKLLLCLMAVFAITVQGCGKSNGIEGTWECTEHYIPGMVGKMQIEFKDDSNAVIKPLGVAATYEIKDNKVILKSTLFNLELEQKEDKLVSKSAVGQVVYEKK